MMNLLKTLMSCMMIVALCACAETGVDGTNGIDGVNGVDGVDGAAGPAGTNGQNGLDGTNGTNGANGQNGLDGTNGVDGIDGQNGQDGSDGQNGLDGQNGTNGQDGQDGQDMTECLVGDGSISDNYVIEYCGDYVSIAAQDLQWKLVGQFQSAPSGCDMGEDECEGYAEVPAYDAASERAFVVNAVASSVDIIDLSSPHTPTLFNQLVIAEGEPNSVAVSSKGLVGVAVARDTKQDNGLAMFFDAAGNLVAQVTAGPLPDMIAFTHDGTKAIIANEGEPSSDYSVDPEGTITIVDVSGIDLGDSTTFTNISATQVGFSSFNDQEAALKTAGVRIFGPNATVAQDLEPEYIAVAADDLTATVVLQENNAVATLNLTTNTIDAVHALGFKDYAGLSFDYSDKDDGVNWQPDLGVNVKGMYQPDAMTSFEMGGETYYVSANEGDARDYWFDAADEATCLAAGGVEFDEDDGCLAYSEEVRADDLTLDTTVFPAELTNDDLGRLKTTTANDCGDIDADGDVDFICSYGARSFSIWKYDGAENFVQVWDSGDETERLMAVNGEWLNSYTNKRNDDKGAEPEGVITGKFLGRTLAFVALERSGGVVVYDVTNPEAPVFQQYIYLNDHVSPEAMAYVSSAESPNGSPMLIVANEVSGTVAILQPTL